MRRPVTNHRRRGVTGGGHRPTQQTQQGGPGILGNRVQGCTVSGGDGRALVHQVHQIPIPMQVLHQTTPNDAASVSSRPDRRRSASASASIMVSKSSQTLRTVPLIATIRRLLSEPTNSSSSNTLPGSVSVMDVSMHASSGTVVRSVGSKQALL